MTQKTQNSEHQDLPSAQETQEAIECQETPTYLEPLKLPTLQESLETGVPHTPLDPLDAQEFLEPSAHQESLEGLIAALTSAASEFPQSPGGLEGEAFSLEYCLAFSGDAQKLSEFLVQLNSYMRVRGHLYPTEATIVSFVGNCFSGEARMCF